MSDERNSANGDDVLAALAAGQPGALERLYRELRAPVFALALSIVGNRAAAEDVLHDTFVRVCERAAAYRAGTSPRAWVITIAKNLAIDTTRRRKRETRLEDAPLACHDDLLPDFSWVQALMRLDPIEREIVVLHALAGLTHAEIASQLRLPAGTVRWKYRDALRRLAPFVSERADV
jgi:RNA polymerase sigma-70 factor (ECF subfamily)